MLEPSVPVKADTHPPKRIEVPVDGCPSCVVNTEEPLDIIRTTGTTQLTTFYRCSDCGHRWHTTWDWR